MSKTTTRGRAAHSVEELPIGDVVVDSGTQVRVEIDDETVERYAELLKDGGIFPPITVFRVEGRLILADGFHRVAAHVRAEIAVIKAEVRSGTWDEAVWFALGANREHGLALRRGDLAAAIKLAIKNRPEASNRDIGRHVGCAHSYVGRIKGEMDSSVQLPARTRGADNKSYPARRPSGKRSSGSSPAPVGSETEAAESSSSGPGPGAAPVEVEPGGEPESPAERVGISNRVLEGVAATAATLGVNDHLIVLDDLDRDQLPAWLEDVRTGRRYLDDLITRLEEWTRPG